MSSSQMRLASLAGLFALAAMGLQARTLDVGEGKAYAMPSLAAAAAAQMSAFAEACGLPILFLTGVLLGAIRDCRQIAGFCWTPG